jgi:ketosteroid isomerase-like protein
VNDQNMDAQHANVEGIRRVFEAFTGGDSRVLFEVIAEDAVWTVPGETQVARVYDGRHEIFDLFRATRRLTGGTYRSELQWALADDDHGVAVYRASGTRAGGRELSIDQLLLIRFRDGRWAEIRALPTEPVEFERFWA